MADDDAAHVHLTRLAIDIDVRDPRCPRRAEPWPFAVDIAGIRHALSVEDVALPAHRAGGGARLPACARRRGLQQFKRPGIVEVTHPKLHRVDAGGAGEFVHVRLVREGIRQRRHASQPGSAQDRRHVVDCHAQVGVCVGRARRAVSHLERLGCRFDRAREQQRQRRRPIRGVGRTEIVTSHRPVGVEPAAHLHPLRSALRLPEVLLLPGQLHADRRTRSP